MRGRGVDRGMTDVSKLWLNGRRAGDISVQTVKYAASVKKTPKLQQRRIWELSVFHYFIEEEKKRELHKCLKGTELILTQLGQLVTQ